MFNTVSDNLTGPFKPVNIIAEKSGYPFFMIKEIHEEPEAVRKTLRPRIKDGIPDLGIPDLTDEMCIRDSLCVRRTHTSECDFGAMR